MSILNVNQLQPVGGGNTITVSAPDVSASAATITVATVQVGSATTIHTTGIDLGDGNIQSHNINSTGIITATEVNVTGTLTYEDVTNIDAVGIITAQAGIHVTGGEVGIGLTNPTAKFQVNGISNGLQARFGGNGTGLGISCFQKTNNNAGVIIEAQDATHGTLTFKTAGAERVRITSAGNVAIGTDTISNTNLTIFGDGTGDNKPATLYQNALTGTGSGSGFYVGINHNDQVGYVWNYEPHALSFATNNTERLGITSEGRVGINETNPSAKLQVLGGNGDQLWLDNGGQRFTQISLQHSGTQNGALWLDDTDSMVDLYANAGHGIRFKTGGNNVRMGITSEGYLNPAPSGMVIRSGFYDTGTGSGARTVHAGTGWTTININGTGQVGHNIGKFSDDGITYNKISNNSHLNISVCFPYYFGDQSGGGGGFGIRAFLSTDDGSNYYSLSGLSQGPTHGWGSGAYGGPEAGVFSYTWNTRMNSSRASTILAKTGSIRLYFEVRTWSGTSSVYMIDYNNDYPKKGSIIVQEIAE